MKLKSVLIAYQDDLWARSLTTLFHDRGYNVETARMLGEMIRKVRNDKTHVLLLDDEIEGMKACDIVPLLKQINPRVQVILISSEESLSVARRLRGAGIFYHAMKPIDSEEIRSAVECAFEKIERENMKEGFFFCLIPKMLPV
jgi:DNA-binding NtrC family response regulator